MPLEGVGNNTAEFKGGKQELYQGSQRLRRRVKGTYKSMTKAIYWQLSELCAINKDKKSANLHL